ncbi:hypothetical protein AGDE_14498 [Angomonas deanei]|uniref:Uncharacterized protein n=1 Tax=Angomonas deanei TaxID=59799 RepID=A0A7G2CKQ0_9TRYP|nr:hypothetical protein AGDE_14498 [Angomonas deanei]CAD2220440.1 hypothetical protein, conserved [Angomonas deanei]|eukprot:EPY20752.1 hypothetical protein AGDE_14498 [Angomonas deanei]
MVFFAAVAQRCQLSSTTGGKKMKTDGEKKKKKQKQGKSLKEMKEERCKDLKSLRTWITLPIVQATANVIDNITLLRKIRRKEVDKHGNDLPKKSDAEKQMEEDQRAMNEALFNDNPIVYPTGTRRQEEESFYSELVQLVDGYCPDGRLSELISVVEDPSIFRFMRDHIGYAELHPDTDWLTYLQIGGIVTTIILIYYAVVSFGRNYVVPKNEEYKQNLIKQQNRERMEQMRKQTEGQYGQRPNETAFEAHQRRMKEMEELARKKGVKMNIRFEADL